MSATSATEAGPGPVGAGPVGAGLAGAGPVGAGLAGAGLRAGHGPLSTSHDVALLDLDGVVYKGRAAVPNAVEALASARSAGMRLAFVTNNALRTPVEVAAHLTSLGVPAVPDEVVTSSQAAARMLAERLPTGAPVLVAGGRGLVEAVEAAGLTVVTSADAAPAAVVQGFDPELTYARLAEAALAVRAGATWVATNTDATVPTERGQMPGNGSLVALVATATGESPFVAGKPEHALHAESVRRSRATHPLVVGDRLDTDIEAAVRWETPSLLVLTGVSSGMDVLLAPAHRRPDYLAADLRGLGRVHPGVTRAGPDWRCGRWTAGVDDGRLRWRCETQGDSGGGDGLDALRVACMAAWAASDAGTPPHGIEDPPEESLLPAGDLSIAADT